MTKKKTTKKTAAKRKTKKTTETSKMKMEGKALVLQAKRWYLDDNPNGMKTLTEDFGLTELQARAIFEGTAIVTGDTIKGLNFKPIESVKIVNSKHAADKAPCVDCGQTNGQRCIYRDKKSFKRYCCQSRAQMVDTAKELENILSI